jgi:hypothetical protein
VLSTLHTNDAPASISRLLNMGVEPFLVTAGGLALAQKKGAAPKGGAGDTGGAVTYQKQTKYDFDDDVVEGDLVRPDGEYVDSRRGAKHSTLIKIRQHFIPEMLKSAEDI